MFTQRELAIESCDETMMAYYVEKYYVEKSWAYDYALTLFSIVIFDRAFSFARCVNFLVCPFHFQDPIAQIVRLYSQKGALEYKPKGYVPDSNEH